MAQDNSNLVDVEKLRKEIESRKDETYNWTYENGRRYASTNMGHYWIPSDEPEIERLNDQYWTLTKLKGGNIHNAPLSKDNENLRVLDIGCGSGIWCMQLAEDYPNATIIGMDVSPIQPERKSERVEWLVYDMEKPWPFPENSFDFIHLSLVHGCVADWSDMMKKIVDHLKPGGYVEHQEFSLGRLYMVDEESKPISFHNSVDDLPPIVRWSRLMEQGGERRGRIIEMGPKLTTFQSSAGLQGISEAIYHLPIGTWPSDEQQKIIGAETLLSVLAGMDGWTTIMFTKALGWSLEETQAFVQRVKRDARDDSMRKVVDMHVVYGRKPGST